MCFVFSILKEPIVLKRMAAFMQSVLLVAIGLIHPLATAQLDIPQWHFKVTLEDSLHLPPGTHGPDLLADTAFTEFVRNLFFGAMVLPIAHIPASGFDLQNATVLEDVNAEAINAHGGVGQGKKMVRFEALLSVDSRPVAS